MSGNTVLMPNLLAKAREHFNEPILVGFDLCRVVGYAEDGFDCYLVVRHPRRGLVRHTFAGGYTYLDCLKGRNHCKSSDTGEDWDDLFRLDSELSLNGAPKESTFILEVSHD